MEVITDDALASAAAAGSRAAFARIVQRYAGAAYSWARGWLPDDEATELVQSIFTMTYEHRDKLTHPLSDTLLTIAETCARGQGHDPNPDLHALWLGGVVQGALLGLQRNDQIALTQGDSPAALTKALHQLAREIERRGVLIR